MVRRVTRTGRAITLRPPPSAALHWVGNVRADRAIATTGESGLIGGEKLESTFSLIRNCICSLNVHAKERNRAQIIENKRALAMTKCEEESDTPTKLAVYWFRFSVLDMEGKRGSCVSWV
jgi:hypothetical protein